MVDLCSLFLGFEDVIAGTLHEVFNWFVWTSVTLLAVSPFTMLVTWVYLPKHRVHRDPVIPK